MGEISTPSTYGQPKKSPEKQPTKLARTKDFLALLSQDDDSWIDPILCSNKQPNSEIAKAVWKCEAKTFIDKQMRAMIEAIIDVFSNPTKYRWECPIPLLIPRAPNWTSKTDSSLDGAGGFCLDLKIWYFLAWPIEIQNRTIRSLAYRQGKLPKHQLITINDLEFAAGIIMYLAVACKIAALTDKPVQAILLNLMDNTSAETWMLKGCTTSMASMALSRILCGCLMYGEVGLNAGFIRGEDNVEADGISRTHKKNETPDFTRLFQEFPSLNYCEQFHPSPGFLCDLFSALLSHESPVPTQVKLSGHFSPAKTSFTSLCRNTSWELPL